MLRGLMGILVRVVPAARQARLDMVTGDPQRKDGHLRVHCQDARSFRCLQIVAIVALGTLIGRTSVINMSTANQLNLDVFVPALVFQH